MPGSVQKPVLKGSQGAQKGGESRLGKSIIQEPIPGIRRGSVGKAYFQLSSVSAW